MLDIVSDAMAEAPAAKQEVGQAVTQTGIAVPVSPVPEELTAKNMLADNLLMLGLLFGIFYFILIRPQQKRVKEHRAMLGGLAKGNRVITSGGLIGTVIKLEGEDVVVIEIAQGVRVRVAKSAISEVTTDKTAPSDSANDN